MDRKYERKKAKRERTEKRGGRVRRRRGGRKERRVITIRRLLIGAFIFEVYISAVLELWRCSHISCIEPYRWPWSVFALIFSDVCFTRLYVG